MASIEHDYDIHGGHAPGCAGCRIEQLTAELAQARAALAERTKAAFMAGYAACDKAWRFNPTTDRIDNYPPSREEAYAAWQASQASARGSRP